MTRALFEENLIAKLADERFILELPLLLASGQDWSPKAAGQLVMDTFCPLLTGEPWKGLHFGT